MVLVHKILFVRQVPWNMVGFRIFKWVGAQKIMCAVAQVPYDHSPAPV